MGGTYCCVGGLELRTNRSLRLLQPNGQNMPDNMPLEVGEIWEMDYVPRQNPRPPHTEDVLLRRYDYLRRQPNLSAFIRKRVHPWQGSPEQLFEGKLCSTPSGSGFVSAERGVPSQSTGYWISDQDLVVEEQFGRLRYIYPVDQGVRSLPYVGLGEPVDCIPQGTLLRVSLARWWRREDNLDVEERCYLQLSGWYEE